MSSEIKMKMSLDSSGVKTALKTMGQKIESFAQKGYEQLNRLVKLVAVGMVGAFTVAAREALQYAKEMTNLSQVANANFEDFQKLAAAAKTVGIEHDKLADIYKDMNDRVGDFLETGGGPMADWFENIAPQIGITAEEFKNLSGPEALQLYYDGLEKTNKSQEEMTFYMEAIASDSTLLIPLLAKGGLKFNELGNAAVANGQVMAAATAKNLKKAQDSIDAFKAKAVIKVGEIIGQPGPAMKKLGAEFMALMAKVGGWLGEAFLQAGKVLNQVFIAAVEVFKDRMVFAFKFAVESFKIALGPVINMITEALGLDFKIDTSDATAKIMELGTQTRVSFGEVFTRVGKELGDINVDVSSQVEYWRQIAREQGKILTTTEEIKEFQRQQTGQVKDQAGLEEKKKELKQAQLELEAELYSKNHDIKAELQNQISELERIIALVEQYPINLDKAVEIVNRQNVDLRDQQKIHEAIEQARAIGDERAITYWNNILGLQDRALALMKETGADYQHAYDLAYEQYVLKEGDLDLNGKITLEEKKQHENILKIIAKAQKKKELSEKEHSILVRKLLPSYEKNKKLHEEIYGKLQSQEGMKKKLLKHSEQQGIELGKQPPIIDEINYKTEKTADATENVVNAEVEVGKQLDKSNAKRREALGLANALKAAGGNQIIDVNVNAKVGSELSSFIVPHLQAHTRLLSSIDNSLKC